MFVHFRKYRTDPKDKKYFYTDKIRRVVIEPSIDDPDLLYAFVEFLDGSEAEVFDIIDGEVM